MTKLKAIEQLALTKFKADSGCRDNVTPGEYSGTMALDVSYKIKIGEDYPKQNVSSIPWQQIAIALASRVNEATLNAVVGAVMTGEFDMNSDQESRMLSVIAPLRKATTITANGPITGIALVEKIVKAIPSPHRIKPTKSVTVDA